METYKIFKKTLAYKLIAQGNILLDKEPNIKNSKYSVYIFKKDEKFTHDLEILTQEY